MNGRIYDPVIGRFVSADPAIQDPYNLQSYNRYAYVLNNPLGYTDPSGYWSLGGIFRAAVIIVAAYFTGGAAMDAYASSAAAATGAAAGSAAYASAYAAAMATTTAAAIGGAAGGFTAGLLSSGGDLRAGLTGAITGGISAGLFYEVGTLTNAHDVDSSFFGTPDHLANIAGHAAVGCAMAAAQGGRCSNGAAAAGFGAVFTPIVPKGVPGLMITTTIGGTASVLGGGKFANGAAAAAFGYLFNQQGCSSSNSDRCAFGTAFDGTPSRQELAQLRQQAADFMDKSGKVFIYGGAFTAVLPPPLDVAAVPLVTLGGAMSITSDLLAPSPVRVSTDMAVDKLMERSLPVTGPAGAVVKGMSQAVKDLKNLTPLGNY